MVTKIYKASTTISVNIILKNGQNYHIAFLPNSNGSSSYTTSNEEIQDALEHHFRFNELFRCSEVHEEKKKTEKKKQEAPKNEVSEAEEPVNESEESENETKEETEDNLQVVEVADLQSAKDYLADSFGLSRTKLRSKKAIVDAATANGIKFVGLD